MPKSYIESDRDLLSERIEDLFKEKIGKKTFYRNFFEVIPYPNIFTLLWIVAFIILFWIIPAMHDLAVKYYGACFNFPEIANEEMITFFSTLWQVQGGISAAALPILIFVIELSKDEQRAAKRSAEVLARETYIFPIIFFSLVVTAKIGIDTCFYSRDSIYYSDILLFILTILLSCFAYYKALSIILNRTKLKKQSFKLLKEKMSKCLDYSIETRIGQNILIKEMGALGIAYNYFLGRDNSDAYEFLETSTEGIVDDINLKTFKKFIHSLNSQLTRTESDDSLKVDARKIGKPEISLLFQYRDRIGEQNRKLLAIKRSSISIDAFGKNKREFERSLKKIIIIVKYEN